MRTIIQMMRGICLKLPVNKDLFYKPVNTGLKKFNPLKILHTLEKNLPFKPRLKYLNF